MYNWGVKTTKQNQTMKKTYWIFVLLVSLIMFNCASTVTSKKFTDDSLDNYQTFAYLPETQMSPSEFNRAVDEYTDDNAVTQLKTQMENRGFTLDSNNPDLLVLISGSIGINSNQRKNGRNTSAGASSGSTGPYAATATSSNITRSSGNTANSNRPYQTGNMVIEVFDSNTKELIWVGMVKDFKNDIASTSASSSMVDAIFTKFPKD